MEDGMDKESTYNERSEDECDQMVADEAYREYLESGEKSRPIKELWNELEL